VFEAAPLLAHSHTVRPLAVYSSLMRAYLDRPTGRRCSTHSLSFDDDDEEDGNKRVDAACPRMGRTEGMGNGEEWMDSALRCVGSFVGTSCAFLQTVMHVKNSPMGIYSKLLFSNL
jgi:hypothetical protein